MTKRKKDDTLIDQAIVARQARMIELLLKVTLAQLNPDPEFRAAASAAFDAAVIEEPGP
jgi:hypothetical protein